MWHEQNFFFMICLTYMRTHFVIYTILFHFSLSSSLLLIYISEWCVCLLNFMVWSLTVRLAWATGYEMAFTKVTKNMDGALSVRYYIMVVSLFFSSSSTGMCTEVHHSASQPTTKNTRRFTRKKSTKKVVIVKLLRVKFFFNDFRFARFCVMR